MDITNWFHIITDLIISISSIITAVYIIRFIKNKPKLPVKGAIWFFAFFVFCSGLIYLGDFIQTWILMKDVDFILRLITAFTSIVGLILITRFFPVAIALKSPVEYQDLEQLVAERTRDLEHALKNEKAAIHELKRNQMGLEFLKDASEVLSSTLNYCEVMERLTRTLTPKIADWCTIYEYGEDGSLKLVIVSHSNPDLYPIAVEISQKYPPNPDYPDGVYKVIESQKPILNKSIPDEMIVQGARDPEHLRLLKLLEIRSSILVPLFIRDKMFGVLMLVWSDPKKQYDEKDLEFAKEIGRQTMLAVENARLYEESQKMNEELMLSKNRAEESDKLKSAFLANMSHEIRTPLNAILGFSAFLKNPEISENRVDEFVEIIEASGQQLLTIINDILEISQIEAGHIKIQNEPVNISKLLNELFIRFNKDALAKNILLILNINKSSYDIITRTDANRIRQILSNLLNNAIKFTPEGKVEFAARTTNDQVIFYVKDTGIGIAPEDQAMIFQPFRQVENTMSRNYGGNGLGLSICKALVEKLNGKLTVHSAPGKGSTFTFAIPWVNGEVPLSENEVIEPLKIARKYDWQNYVILIAEDEIFNYQFFEEILLPTNVKILHAKDGREAVDMVRTHPEISLVVMDLKMPGMDGYKASELIKQIRPDLPVIAQTATVLDDIRNISEEEHFDQYVTKPIEIKSFMEVLDNYLYN